LVWTFGRERSGRVSGRKGSLFFSVTFFYVIYYVEGGNCFRVSGMRVRVSTLVTRKPGHFFRFS